MAAELILTPDAGQDISDAYDWYEQRRTGLGEEFLSCLDATIQSICRTPELYGKAYKDYRRALIRRFPYMVWYESSSNRVTIYSVFHSSRNPAKWRKRLS